MKIGFPFSFVYKHLGIYIGVNFIYEDINCVLGGYMKCS